MLCSSCNLEADGGGNKYRLPGPINGTTINRNRILIEDDKEINTDLPIYAFDEIVVACCKVADIDMNNECVIDGDSVVDIIIDTKRSYGLQLEDIHISDWYYHILYEFDPVELSIRLKQFDSEEQAQVKREILDTSYIINPQPSL